MRMDFRLSPTVTSGSNHLPVFLIPENIQINKSELQALLPTTAMPYRSEMNAALLVVPEPTQKIKSALQLRQHMLFAYWKWQGSMLWSSPFHVSVSLTMLVCLAYGWWGHHKIRLLVHASFLLVWIKARFDWFHCCVMRYCIAASIPFLVLMQCECTAVVTKNSLFQSWTHFYVSCATVLP